LQAYPDSLLCKLVDDNAADGVVLARSSTGDDEQRKPIAIDRDPALFKQVLVTSIVNTPRNTVKVPDAEAALLWAELDFYGLLPQMKGGESVSKGKRKMLPAAVLRHETARDSAKTAKLLDTRKALITRDNTEMVSLIVSQMSEIVARKLLTRSQANQTLGETSDALLHTANPEPAANLEHRLVDALRAAVGASTSSASDCVGNGAMLCCQHRYVCPARFLHQFCSGRPCEEGYKYVYRVRCELAGHPPGERVYFHLWRNNWWVHVNSGDDGQPQVLSMVYPYLALPAECANRPPKTVPAELRTLLKTHLTELGFKVTLDDSHGHTRITVSWK
jgi:hypothetical protein